MFTKVVLVALFASVATPLPTAKISQNGALRNVVNSGIILPEERLHPDAGHNILQIVERAGYPLERHGGLVTEDGYILEIHRIPHGLNYKDQTGKTPVFLMHGLTSSSVDWVMLGPGIGLAYILADLGYDVWMGNARGNEWSRKHNIYDPDVDQKEFWNYSWNEIGLYDLPVMIDYALKVNGADKLFYIGHSQGTTSFFVMASEKPEYNNKIRLMSALGPAAYMTHVFCPFCQLLAQFDEDIEWLAENVGLYEFAPKSEVVEIIGKELCEETSPVRELCSNFIFLLCGFDSDQLNRTLVPVILSNIPSGSASKQFLHYGQEVKSGHFRKFDYHSDEENLEKYGQVTPPDYKISNIVAPIALHYGQNDWLVSVKDVQRLRAELPNVVLDNKIAYERFNHIDFLWATNARELLYNDLIESMTKF